MPDSNTHLLDDLKLMSIAAREAGAVAMQYYRGRLDQWDKEPGHPVTEADIAVNLLLENKLRTARPDYGWLSEETADDEDRFERKHVFVVDPIDGTRAFMRGDPHFCISLALLDGTKPVAGVLYAPVFDELYAAAEGHGSWRNGMAISVRKCGGIENCRMIGEPRMFGHPDWPQPWPELVHPVLKPNSTAYRMALVADGRWDGVMVLSNKGDWDVAAAALIVEEAGGRVTDHLGRSYVFNQTVPSQLSLIAASPDLHGLLVERTKHIRLPEPSIT